MQVQRFRKPTVREALAEVRGALGPDALVLSTNTVPLRGWRRLTGRREVEVMATRGLSLSESRPVAPSTRPDVHRAEVPEQKMVRASAQSGSDVVARLQAAGLDRGMATEVAAALPPASRRDPSQRVLLDSLASRLAALTAAVESTSGVEVFVGPPGAGKTTTIAKLAARLRARDGRRPALIAADGYRVGAVEQLRIYAEILGLPFFVARTALDLDRALAQVAGPVFVDTAGRSPADRGTRDLFDALRGRPGVCTHLVLAAGTPSRDAARVLERYHEADPARVVLSKIDETEMMAPLVGLLRSRGLKISWLGTGQRVPEDLSRATGRLLAAMMLGESWSDGQSSRTSGTEEPCA